MKWVLLKDIAQIAAGQSAPQDESVYETMGIPFIRAGHLQFLISNCNEDALPKISEENACHSKLKKYPPGTIIFAKSGMSCMKGYVYTLHSTCYVVSHLAVIIPSTEVYSEYLRHYFSFHRPNSLVKDEAYPSISLSEIGNLEIKLYPLDVQSQIITKLNSVEQSIKIRQGQLKKLDDLASSRFVEMFGDPAENPWKWPVVPIETVLSGKASNGFFAKREEYVEKGNASVIGVVDIVDRMYPRLDVLPQVIASQKDIQKYSVKYGDILFCRSSLVKAGIAKASIVPFEVEKNTMFECHVIRLPLDLSKCIPEFIQMQTTTSFFRNQVMAQSKTATMTTISQGGILKSQIIVPPFSRQKEFVSFIKQLDKSKVTIRKSIEKLELLYKALLQEYFG